MPPAAGAPAGRSRPRHRTISTLVSSAHCRLPVLTGPSFFPPLNGVGAAGRVPPTPRGAHRQGRSESIVSTAARKARKRAGVKLANAPKRPTRRWADARGPRGLGLTSSAEILAAIVVRGL